MFERILFGAAAVALWGTAKAIPQQIVDSADGRESGDVVATNFYMYLHTPDTECDSAQNLDSAYMGEVRFGQCEAFAIGSEYYIIGGCDELGRIMLGAGCDAECSFCNASAWVYSYECPSAFLGLGSASFQCSDLASPTSTTRLPSPTTSGDRCPYAPVVNNAMATRGCAGTGNGGTCPMLCEEGYAPKDDAPVMATCQNGLWFVSGFCLRPGSSGEVRPVLQSNWNLDFTLPLSSSSINDVSAALVGAVTVLGDLADGMVRVDIAVPEDLSDAEAEIQAEISYPEAGSTSSTSSSGGTATSSSPGARRLAQVQSFRSEISIILPESFANYQVSEAAALFEDLQTTFTGDNLKNTLVTMMPGDMGELVSEHLQIESAGPFSILDSYVWIEPEWLRTSVWSDCDCEGTQTRTRDLVCSVDQWTLCTGDKPPIVTESCKCGWDIMCPWGSEEDTEDSCNAQFGITVVLMIVFGSCLLVFLILLFWAIIRTPCIHSGGLTVKTDHGVVKTKYNIGRGTSEEHAGRKVVKWGLSDDDAKVLFPQAGTAETPKKEDIEALFRYDETHDIESQVPKTAGQESQDADDDASPTARMWLDSKASAFRDKETAEYFSMTLGMWRPSHVKRAVSHVGNYDMHVRVRYDVYLPKSGQVRRDAGLFDLRKAFRMGEKVEVFFPDAASGSWKNGEIAEMPSVSSTTYGYIVQIEDNGNDKPSKIMPVRLRRRFEVDEEVLVYCGINQGWSTGTIKTVTPEEGMVRGDKEIIAGPAESSDPLSVERWSVGKDVPKGMVPWQLVGVMLESNTSSDTTQVVQAFPTYLIKRQQNDEMDNNLSSAFASAADAAVDTMSNAVSGMLASVNSTPSSPKANA